MTAAAAARRRRFAVLGAGVMGCSVALELAQRGEDVVLVDAADAPFRGASRWNEGKLHLGFLYAADPSLSTARSVLRGGLQFVDRVRALLDCDPTPAISEQDDCYLVHRNSVVDAATTGARFAQLCELIRSCSDAGRYPGDASNARVAELGGPELAQLADAGAIVAGFRVPERSIATTWLADRFVEAVRAHPRIELMLSTRVRSVAAVDCGGSARWRIDCGPALEDLFDGVVNALWEGRLAVDHSVGLLPAPGWSHRYRVSLFVRTTRALPTASAVICTGPFGDVKNYNGRDFYLSWYPAGLLAEGHALAPPPLPASGPAATQRIIDSVRLALGDLLPGTREIFRCAESIDLQGGWVFAQGRGSLADPAASLHRRDRFGIVSRGSYLSVDTGKYSTAPWLAQQVADRLLC